LRSRQNAIRHGLSAETVIEIVEDINDYKGFEAAIIADSIPARPWSVYSSYGLHLYLWRLRRAAAIETELFRIQAEILRDRALGRVPVWPGNAPNLGVAAHSIQTENENDNDPRQAEPDPCDNASPRAPQPVNSARQLAVCFQRTANLDNAMFERLGRYESALAPSCANYFLLQSVRVR
jgi:hypothetical protein